MPYRDHRQALEDRRAELVQRLEALDARAERLEHDRRASAAWRRELADVEQKLAAASARRSLPLLENVRIAAPCNESWEEMKGDEHVRFCAGCKQNVFNLSAMTREQAEELLAQTEGRLCVRLYRRADGTVITSDCSVGVSRRRRRRALVAAGAGLLAAASAATMIARPAPAGAHVFEPKEPAMGATVVPEPPAPPVQPPTPFMGQPVMGAPAPQHPVMGHVSRPVRVRQSTPAHPTMGSAVRAPVAAEE